MYWDPMPTVADSATLPVASLENLRVLGPPDEYFRGEWEQRDWRNVPGPFYGANTDSCWCGPLIAPDHIIVEDRYGSEVVFRQPSNARETHLILSAAWSDPFGAYACDGNERWTPDLVRAWWADRARLVEWIDTTERAWSASDREGDRVNAEGLRAYRGYLGNGLETYLQEYIFWLENR
ncbi:ferredoxin [Nocardia halotolerans]|uniref:Ferredoxin n=1 Tax=Nocardia halotolerans TaxID=1755878 RepID=A0ABV8VIL4_9NOCA